MAKQFGEHAVGGKRQACAWHCGRDGTRSAGRRNRPVSAMRSILAVGIALCSLLAGCATVYDEVFHESLLSANDRCPQTRSILEMPLEEWGIYVRQHQLDCMAALFEHRLHEMFPKGVAAGALQTRLRRDGFSCLRVDTQVTPGIECRMTRISEYVQFPFAAGWGEHLWVVNFPESGEAFEGMSVKVFPIRTR